MPAPDPAMRSSRAHVIVGADTLRVESHLPIDDATEHHLRRVVRLRDGDPVSVTDGAGSWRLTVVVAGDGEWHLEPTTELVSVPARSAPVEVAAAIPKGDRLDWMVQKVAEVGADRLTLLHCERSVVRWKPAKVDAQRARLQRIADEACRQSRRVWTMTVDGPVGAADVLAGAVVAEPDGRPLRAGDRRIAIGPEGGWSRTELEMTTERVRLGDAILRIETAAVVAVALCVTINR
jgi:16S rRNA (uracil1498-N3)-methyltransferase